MRELRVIKELEGLRKEKSVVIAAKEAIPVVATKAVDGYVVKKVIDYIQLLVDGDVVCSDEPLPKDTVVNGYLKPLEAGLTECGIDERNARAYLKYVGGKSLIDEYERRASDYEKGGIGNPRLSALASIANVYRFYRYDPDLGRKVLEEWGDFKEEVFSGYDPWIANVYRAYLTPYPVMKYSPHLFLGTNPQVGKSYLASALGDRLERATPVSLIGGRFEGGVEAGILNGKDYLVQIEALELKGGEDREAVNYLLNLLANGVAVRAVSGVVVRTESTAPLVFTFNISVLDPLQDLANLISVFSHNPMAMAERFVLLANNSLMRPRGPEFPTDIVHEALMATRELVREKVTKLYSSRDVRKWLEEYLEGWDEVGDRVGNYDWGLDYVRRFMSNYADSGWRRLKALALGRAVSEDLDRLWRGEVSVQEILGKAEEYLSTYLRMAIDSIEVFKGEYRETIDRLITKLAVSDKAKFERAVLEALHAIVNKKYGMQAYTNIEAEVSIKELADLIKTMKKEWYLSIESIKKKLRKLEVSGVFMLMSLKVGEDKVTINARALNEVYQKYLEEITTK